MTDGRDTLKVVMLYEDLATGLYAKEACDRLSRVLGAKEAMDISLWRVDLLRLPALRTVAAEATIAADVIMISAYETDELLSMLRTWFEEWIPRKRPGDTALVALLTQEPARRHPGAAVRAQLAALAIRAQMDFFPVSLMRTGEDAGCCAAGLNERARTVSSLLEGILQYRPPPPGWTVGDGDCASSAH